MLPAETKAMLDGVVAHQRLEYERRKEKSLCELTFKMFRQGLGRSSVFDQSQAQVFYDGFEKYAQRVWEEVQRVLQETQFTFYGDCERDLVQYLDETLAILHKTELTSFGRQKHLTAHTIQSSFQAGLEFRRKHATKRLATEVKIFCAKLQAGKDESPQATTQTKSFVDWAGEDRVTLAIVFTDIAGSTALGEEVKDEQMNEVRRAHFTQGRQLIAQFNGYEIKTMGDSFMVAFRSVEKALDFARSLQSNPGHSQIHIRAGIHIGPLRVEEGDVFGSTVNFADRVSKANKAAEIWLSDRAKQDIDSLGADHHRTLKWERHDGIELHGFNGTFTLWSLTK
jgi:class 3 adenylate cyclase